MQNLGLRGPEFEEGWEEVLGRDCGVERGEREGRRI